LSLKENVEVIKEELSSEEKFLEQAIRAERGFKRYKKPIFGVLGALILGALSYQGLQMYHEMRLAKSNDAYLVLKKDANNQEALKTLQENNPALYEIFLFSQAMQTRDVKALQSFTSSKDPILSDVASYQLVAMSPSAQTMQSYSMKQDAVLKDIATLNSAYLLIQEGQKQKARESLSAIGMQPTAQRFAKLLQHFSLDEKQPIKEEPKDANNNLFNNL
jgi:hypothetical protein